MSTAVRSCIAVPLLVMFVTLSWALINSGIYGFTLFLLMPAVLGGMAAWVFRPATSHGAAGTGALAAFVALVGLLFVAWEGLLCIAMAAPLAIPLGALGGWLVHWGGRSAMSPRAAALFLVLPSASVTWDVAAQPQFFAVRSALEIAAPPERVWRHVVSFSDLPEPTEWFFRAGLAYPRRARIVGAGPGAVRYCDFSTGPFVEPIEVWDEPRLLRFRVTQNPAPMNEWSPYAGLVPRHLHGYFVSRQGQFQLTALPNGNTLLEGTTWYRHGLWPGEYWRWWSDAIIHRIHLRVLTHIRALAESRYPEPSQ